MQNFLSYVAKFCTYLSTYFAKLNRLFCKEKTNSICLKSNHFYSFKLDSMVLNRWKLLRLILGKRSIFPPQRHWRNRRTRTLAQENQCIGIAWFVDWRRIYTLGTAAMQDSVLDLMANHGVCRPTRPQPSQRERSEKPSFLFKNGYRLKTEIELENLFFKFRQHF